MGDYIESLMQSAKPISSILKDLQTGKLQRQDVFAHFKSQYRPIVAARVKAFQLGDLFIAQRATLGDWLQMRGRQTDLNTWLDVRAEVDMAQMKLDEVRPLHEFYCARVESPGPTERKKLLEVEGSAEFNKYRERWGLRNAREGWSEWRP